LILISVFHEKYCLRFVSQRLLFRIFACFNLSSIFSKNLTIYVCRYRLYCFNFNNHRCDWGCKTTIKFSFCKLFKNFFPFLIFCFQSIKITVVIGAAKLTI
jgi:hypothetical protein